MGSRTLWVEFEPVRMKNALWTTILLALLALWLPAEARAHAGHNHGQDLPSSVNEVVPLQEDADAMNRVDVAKPAHLTLTWPSLAASGLEKSAFCLGGCCSAAHSSCCALTLPGQIQLTAPVYRRVRMDLSILGGPGITLGALPEPPKFVV